MLETGQPLHAFDYDKLKGGRIVVRRARSGESMTTLDGVERTLTPGMLVIADAERAVALAGIMGGAETEMSDSTTTVLIESAHFAPLTIRRTAKAQAISTEASYRFQRYVDPAGVAAAANRACELIAEVGAGDPDTELADVYPDPIQPRTIIVRPERVTAMLGFDVSLEEVTESLQWLGFERRQTFFTPYSSLLEFVVPSWRPDIVREIDMVEEVGRVLGYENIPEKLPEGHSTQGGDSAAGRFAERVREALVGAGLQEIVSHSLLAPTNLEDPRSEELRVPIRSALSAELSGLRRSLLPGLMDALERNGRRGNSPLAFFEIGKVFSRSDGFYCEAGNIGGVLAGPLGPATWDKRSPVLPADFHAARGIVELMCDRLHVTGLRFAECDDPRFHPGRSATILFGNIDLGYVGELHPRLSADLRIRDRIVVFELMVDPLQISAAAGKGFQPISAYPAVSRDLAPRVDAAVPYSTVEAAVHSAGVPLLEEFRLTDVFTGAPLPAGMKSLTLSFTFRAPDRTLTDAEVTDALARIRTTLETGCGASFAG